MATICGSQKKHCYSKSGAIRAALSYSRRRGVALRPYFHHDCKSWHLTRNAKW